MATTAADNDHDHDDDDDSEGMDEDYTMTHFPDAWEFLVNSHAYQWLIGRIQTEMLVTQRAGTAAESIRTEIVKGSASLGRSHGDRQGTRKVRFDISWELPGFLREQYPEESELDLGSLITIVGIGNVVQALTCAQYMRQVWPVTDLETLKALQEALDKGKGQMYQSN